jgi:hypothetical protein
MSKIDNINRFIKFLPKYIKDIDVNGLKLYMSGEFDRLTTRSYDFYVPTLKISNPKNLPFSYNSLVTLVADELVVLDKLLSTNLTMREIESLVKFDDFERHQFYIPNVLENEFLKCINKTDLKESISNIKGYYQIKGMYVVDNDFDMYWDDSESFHLDISLVIDEFKFKGINSSESKLITDAEEIIHNIYDLKYDYSEYFEDPIWGCLSDYLFKYPSFIDRNWQFVSVNIIPKLID